ncbi:MAG: hypothetical protein JKX87_06660 [Cycloclasticus sp.]|nr:hypothetical protein [Cycloclasticus sp.]
MKIISNTLVYGRYQLADVYGNITPELTEKIVNLWQRNSILPTGLDPVHRVNEVAVVILDDTQKVVGVSSAYIDYRPRLQEHAFMYRMFIQPSDRTPTMMLAVLKQTYALLNSLTLANKPASLMIVTENNKLMRSGMRRQFSRMGFILLGQNPQRQDIWRQPFDLS